MRKPSSISGKAASSSLPLSVISSGMTAATVTSTVTIPSPLSSSPDYSPNEPADSTRVETTPSLLSDLMHSGAWKRDPLPEEFYDRDTIAVARDLPGKVLVLDSGEPLVAGRILETEAYLSDDPASHSYRGMTRRNGPMFGPAGRWYLYTIHRQWCLNLVTMREGRGEAVLIRSLFPLAGLAEMGRRRGKTDLRDLCSGPGKLCQAFGLDGSWNRSDARRGALRLEDWGFPPPPVVTDTRIGLSRGADLPYRFLEDRQPLVSRRRRSVTA